MYYEDVFKEMDTLLKEKERVHNLVQEWVNNQVKGLAKKYGMHWNMFMGDSLGSIVLTFWGRHFDEPEPGNIQIELAETLSLENPDMDTQTLLELVREFTARVRLDPEDRKLLECAAMELQIFFRKVMALPVEELNELELVRFVAGSECYDYTRVIPRDIPSAIRFDSNLLQRIEPILEQYIEAVGTDLDYETALLKMLIISQHVVDSIPYDSEVTVTVGLSSYSHKYRVASVKPYSICLEWGNGNSHTDITIGISPIGYKTIICYL